MGGEVLDIFERVLLSCGGGVGILVTVVGTDVGVWS